MCRNRWLFPQVSTTVWAHVHKYALTQVSNCACLRDCYSAAILHLPEYPCGIHKFTAHELKWNGIERFDCTCKLSTASCERSEYGWTRLNWALHDWREKWFVGCRSFEKQWGRALLTVKCCCIVEKSLWEIHAILSWSHLKGRKLTWPVVSYSLFVPLGRSVATMKTLKYEC